LERSISHVSENEGFVLAEITTVEEVIADRPSKFPIDPRIEATREAVQDSPVENLHLPQPRDIAKAIQDAQPLQTESLAQFHRM
jgi:hypothetical protein